MCCVKLVLQEPNERRDFNSFSLRQGGYDSFTSTWMTIKLPMNCLKWLCINANRLAECSLLEWTPFHFNLDISYTICPRVCHPKLPPALNVRFLTWSGFIFTKLFRNWRKRLSFFESFICFCYFTVFLTENVSFFDLWRKSPAFRMICCFNLLFLSRIFCFFCFSTFRTTFCRSFASFRCWHFFFRNLEFFFDAFQLDGSTLRHILIRAPLVLCHRQISSRTFCWIKTSQFIECNIAISFSWMTTIKPQFINIQRTAKYK